MRLAIFGGTFDPIHNAHLAVAREAAARFELHRVLFVPAERPPHKQGVTHAPYEDRFRMVELACRDDPQFEASRLEQGTVSSYSIDTIEKVRARPGARRRAILSDRRRRLRGNRKLAALAGCHPRRGVHRGEPARAIVTRFRQARRSTAWKRVDLPVSSSEIRRRLAAGDDRVEAPAAVLEYIRAKGLYRG